MSYAGIERLAPMGYFKNIAIDKLNEERAKEGIYQHAMTMHLMEKVFDETPELKRSIINEMADLAQEPENSCTVEMFDTIHKAVNDVMYQQITEQEYKNTIIKAIRDYRLKHPRPIAIDRIELLEIE